MAAPRHHSFQSVSTLQGGFIEKHPSPEINDAEASFVLVGNERSAFGELY